VMILGEGTNETVSHLRGKIALLVVEGVVESRLLPRFVSPLKRRKRRYDNFSINEELVGYVQGLRAHAGTQGWLAGLIEVHILAGNVFNVQLRRLSCGFRAAKGDMK